MKPTKVESPDSVGSLNEFEVPEGWNLATVEDLSETVQYGYTESAIQNSDYPRFLRITDIQDGNVEWKSVPSCEITDEDFPRYELKEGDIVFARTGATTGKSFLIRSCPKAVFASYLIRIRPNKRVDPKFLYLFFQTSDYWRMISENVSGTGQPNCNASKLKNLQLPVPPIVEQQRIVARIEAILAHVNAARERLDRVPLVMKRFRQGVLAAACYGRLTEGWREENSDEAPAHELISDILDERKLWYNSEVKRATIDGLKKPKKPKLTRKDTTSEELFGNLPPSWDICFFEDIAANVENAIKAGPFGSSLTKSCYQQSGYKIYGQEQVIRGDSTYGDYWISEEKFRELESCKIRPDDLLISLVGTVGKVLILPEDCKPGIINPRLVKLSLDQKISKPFIQIFLESPLAKNQLFGDSHGGTMEILNLEIIKNLPIPLPPLAEQHEIVRRVNALFPGADAVEREVAVATKRAEALTQAVLARGFAGKL